MAKYAPLYDWMFGRVRGIWMLLMVISSPLHIFLWQWRPVLLVHDGAHLNAAGATHGCSIKGLDELSCWLWVCSRSCFRQGLWYQNISIRGPVICPTEEVEYHSPKEKLIAHKSLQANTFCCVSVNVRNLCKVHTFFLLVSHVSAFFLAYCWNNPGLMNWL